MKILFRLPERTLALGLIHPSDRLLETLMMLPVLKADLVPL